MKIYASNVSCLAFNTYITITCCCANFSKCMFKASIVDGGLLLHGVSWDEFTKGNKPVEIFLINQIISELCCLYMISYALITYVILVDGLFH